MCNVCVYSVKIFLKQHTQRKTLYIVSGVRYTHYKICLIYRKKRHASAYNSLSESNAFSLLIIRKKKDICKYSDRYPFLLPHIHRMEDKFTFPLNSTHSKIYIFAIVKGTQTLKFQQKKKIEFKNCWIEK